MDNGIESNGLRYIHAYFVRQLGSHKFDKK